MTTTDRQAHASRSRGKTFFALVVLGIFGLMLLSSRSPREVDDVANHQAGTDHPQSAPAPTVHVGDAVVLAVPGSTHAWLAVDDEAWRQMLDAQNAQNYEWMNELIQDGKVIRVRSGTRGRVVEAGLMSFKVRLQDGRTGWIQGSFARKP